jgi:hypothetical protein
MKSVPVELLQKRLEELDAEYANGQTLVRQHQAALDQTIGALRNIDGARLVLQELIEGAAEQQPEEIYQAD